MFLSHTSYVVNNFSVVLLNAPSEHVPELSVSECP